MKTILFWFSKFSFSQRTNCVRECVFPQFSRKSKTHFFLVDRKARDKRLLSLANRNWVTKNVCVLYRDYGDTHEECFFLYKNNNKNTNDIQKLQVIDKYNARNSMNVTICYGFQFSLLGQHIFHMWRKNWFFYPFGKYTRKF